MAYPGHHPVITNYDFWDGIMINNGASYIIIDGFTVIGDAQKTTASQAQSLINDPGNLATNGNCIGVNSGSHHIVIRNNNLSYCPGGGLGATGDYIYVHHNIIHHNAWWSPLNDSGVTMGGQDNADHYTGAKNFVYSNVLYDNQNFVCNVKQTSPCRITDGEGIIVDSNKASGFGGRTEIFNNITYNNGGAGIEVVNSQHVDIFNNTTYMNNQSAAEPASFRAHTAGGEIEIAGSTDIFVLNNIMYGSSNVPMMYPQYGNNSLTWDYNILFNGTGAAAVGPHDLIVDPLFVQASAFNFQLQSKSPAIASGTASMEPSVDFAGKPRPLGVDDRGAYQTSVRRPGS
jgi:hypothetical protein